MAETTMEGTSNSRTVTDQNVVRGGAGSENSDNVIRANFYGLLARALARPLDEDALQVMRGLADHDDDTPLGQAIQAFGKLCARTPLSKANEEFTELFYGYGAGGELTPYASFYLTGLIYDKPLAALREDMARFGIERDAENPEPEDHIAAVCEIMQGILTGAFDGASPSDAKPFFDKHIAPWAGNFFADMEKSQAASLYMPVGTIGRLFVEIERETFEMAA